MTKQILYKYLGTNGAILSPVHLEDIYYIRKIQLTAETGKLLRKKGTTSSVFSVLISEDEVDDWEEIEAKQD